MKKKNIIILMILVFLLCGIVGYLIYPKQLNKAEKDEIVEEMLDRSYSSSMDELVDFIKKNNSDKGKCVTSYNYYFITNSGITCKLKINNTIGKKYSVKFYDKFDRFIGEYNNTNIETCSEKLI